MELEKPPPDNGMQRCAHKILDLPNFDHFMGAIILANLVVMIIETDRQAGEADDDIHLDWTEVFGWVVLVIFIVELVLRLVAYQRDFLKDSWNVGDLIIVVTDMVFTFVGMVAKQNFPVTILRVFRLAKLARVSKLLRVFPELRMLLAGFVHSLRAIFWGSLLLWVSLLVFALVAVILIHPLNKDIDYGPGCDRCNRAYSTVFQAALTFWQQIVTGDSWGVVTIPLIEEYPGTALFFIPCFLAIGLSVMNLMLAVVVNVAQAAYENEGQVEEAERQMQKIENQSNVLTMCQNMDADGSGELSYDEVHAGFMNPTGEFSKSMKDMGITEEDLAIAWSMIDLDRSGSVSYKELVSFLFTMKESDTQFMLTYIKSYITWVRNALSEQMSKQQEEYKLNTKKMEEEIAKVELQEEAILQGQEDSLVNAAAKGTVVQEQLIESRGEEVVSTTIDVDNIAAMQQSKAANSAVKRPVLKACPRPAPVQIPAIDLSSIRPLDNMGSPESDLTKAQNWPFVRSGIDANAGMSTSVRDALQDLVQQFSYDFQRMHLELNGIVRDMSSNLLLMDCPIVSERTGDSKAEYDI